MFSKIPCYIYIYIYITPVLFSRAARCNFVTLLFIYLFFPHLPPSWRLDESWITNLPKVEGRRESERSSIGTQCMMPYQCLFFSDFFLDFNKEKGFVKGLLLLLCCSRLKTSLILHMVAKSSPWLETSLPSITPLLSTISPKTRSCQMSCCYELTKESLFLQMTCYEDHLSCDLVGHWICHTHQWCNGQGH